MNIMLGDLSVSQIEKRLGIEFPQEIRDFMEKTNQPEAMNIGKGKWHCFDIPFTIVCGDMEIATKIFNSVKHKSSQCKEQLHFSLNSNN